MRTRIVTDRDLPDPRRLEVCRRLPEHGPAPLFFSGGSALRGLSRRLKRLTHHSIHIVTPFDSGGSSAVLREAFGVISVGDMRSRLVALSEEENLANAATHRLFSHRLDATWTCAKLRPRLDALCAGEDELVAALPATVKLGAMALLSLFRDRMPTDFDLRGASIGNLMLVAAILEQGDVDQVLGLFSRLLDVRGLVRPVVDSACHLRARLADGTVIDRQHRITRRGSEAIASRIVDLELVCPGDDPRGAFPPMIETVTAERIASASLICFPMGSFYTSVVANLLPRGVGTSVARRCIPKLFIPNTGVDPEMYGLDAAAAAEVILARLRADAGAATPTENLLTHVILDVNDDSYALPPRPERFRDLGIEVLRLPMVKEGAGPSRIDATVLAEFLAVLSS
jgi:CofD-related protein of GAK system